MGLNQTHALKVSAVVEMNNPTDNADIRRFLDMINFLAVHIPNVSTITAPLRSLLKSDTLFTWRATALTKIKEITTSNGKTVFTTDMICS